MKDVELMQALKKVAKDRLEQLKERDNDKENDKKKLEMKKMANIMKSYIIKK